jgi:hypothetical protein
VIRRLPGVGAGALLAFVPGVARAHGVLEGVGDFYAGLLHPVVVPAELLAVVATGLLLGRSGVAACRSGILLLAAGVAAGMGLAAAVGAAGATTPLAAAAFLAAAIVAAGLQIPIWTAASIALFAGFAVGLDARPEASALYPRILGGAATVLGSLVLATLGAAAALDAEKPWHRVAVRVAGSWITASSGLLLAFQLLR